MHKFKALILLVLSNKQFFITKNRGLDIGIVSALLTLFISKENTNGGVSGNVA